MNGGLGADAGYTACLRDTQAALAKFGFAISSSGIVDAATWTLVQLITNPDTANKFRAGDPAACAAVSAAVKKLSWASIPGLLLQLAQRGAGAIAPPPPVAPVVPYVPPPAPPATTGMSPWEILGIGIGAAAILGTIAYFIFRPEHAALAAYAEE